MITNRDFEVLQFINTFGYSFSDVIGKTFFDSSKTASARLLKLKRQGFLFFKNTNLMSPRRAVLLTQEGKNYLINSGIDRINTNNSISVGGVYHLMLEQEIYYLLSSIGTVERTTVHSHKKILSHTPDMIFNDNIFIEAETSLKSKNRYKSLVADMLDEKRIKAVVYVTSNIEKTINLETLAKALPKWKNLYFIDIETLRNNVKNEKKIKAKRQEEF